MKKILLTTLSSILVANILTACNSGASSVTPPNVNDNKVLTDKFCKQMSAGYASKKYNIKDSKGKLHKAIETCSNWHSFSEGNQTQTVTKSSSSLKGGSSAPYLTGSNTVLNWGQGSGNSITWVAEWVAPWWETNYITTTGTGAGNTSQQSTGPGNITTPRICLGDAQYNVSGTVFTNVNASYTNDGEGTTGDIVFQYPVTYINYCSQQGTTAGNFDHYSNVINTYGGITLDQLWDSDTNFNNCTYNTTNPGTGSSNTSMTCNVNESGTLVIQPSETSSDSKTSFNSWNMNATWTWAPNQNPNDKVHK